jgi:hypothetical protein
MTGSSQKPGGRESLNAAKNNILLEADLWELKEGHKTLKSD